MVTVYTHCDTIINIMLSSTEDLQKKHLLGSPNVFNSKPSGGSSTLFSPRNKKATHGAQTPDVGGDFDISFIENNSFIVSPPTESVGFHHQDENATPKEAALAAAMMTAKRGFQTPGTRNTVGPGTLAGGATAGRTPAVPKAAVPTLKEQEKASPLGQDAWPEIVPLRPSS